MTPVERMFNEDQLIEIAGAIGEGGGLHGLTADEAANLAVTVTDMLRNIEAGDDE